MRIDFDRQDSESEEDELSRNLERERGGISIDRAAFSSPSSRPKNRRTRGGAKLIKPEERPESPRMRKFQEIQAKYRAQGRLGAGR